MEKAIKWVKFYSPSHVQTLFVETGFLDSGETEHNFSDGAYAVEHSTEEVFIVWEGQPVGRGSQSE